MNIPFVAQGKAQKTHAGSCHSSAQAVPTGLPLVAIVGSPNVGKSVLFNALTGAYVTVSNFPGTTVELSRGRSRFGDVEAGVVDTPGMYSLRPITEEERVARRILLEERPAVVIHVVDAKSLERMLPMTLQLIEAGLPVVLDVNLMDEAERVGIGVDTEGLMHELGVPVVGTALALNQGVEQIKAAVAARLKGADEAHLASGTQVRVRYPQVIESAAQEIGERLNSAHPLSDRAMALLLLQGDDEVAAQIQDAGGPDAAGLRGIVEATRARIGQPVAYAIARAQREAVRGLLAQVTRVGTRRAPGFAELLSEAMINPWTGVPILLAVLFVLYEFVGVLGAQTLVGFLEEGVFGRYVSPWVDQALEAWIPWVAVRNLIGGEYGVINLGLRYAVALILPLVGTFFIAFSIIEDSGYLPRLALLIDRVFKQLGLNGRAVIPMVLGFGCDTMATIVTRTLETPRERLLSTLLLALAIPCSAQLGVMLGLLGGNVAMVAIWGGVVTLIFLLVGFLAAKLLPGERPSFYMELPPLRLPKLKNIVVKTYTRMEWYLREVIPMFVLASVLIWLGNLTGLFDVVVGAITPLVQWIGLPQEAAVSFLFGFFRRDYGAAGLYDLREVMTGVQLVVAATTLTIFVPCIAQFAVTLKERGWKTALAITAFIFPFAFLIGGLLNRVLTSLGLTL